MKIAILGASSQIAKDLIISFSNEKDKQLHLFARRPDLVKQWLNNIGLSGRYLVDDFSLFGMQEFDAIINFVGVGNPAHASIMGASIFDVTLKYDELAINYLHEHPKCRYIFLSSGAAYGSSFNQPVTINTPAVLTINNLQPQEWYGTAKLHAECRHRAHQELAIVDIRIFNYFSHTQDIESRFLITDILRAIRDKTVLKISADYIVRDFLHPSDFHQLVELILAAPEVNAAVDCYSLAPVDKPSLLNAMHEKFSLRYETDSAGMLINATGIKTHYYSTNTSAADFGYLPIFTSLNGVLVEAEKALCRNTILSNQSSMNFKEYLF